MTVFGTKIISDIHFPLDLSHETETRYALTLSFKVPQSCKNSITCGFPLLNSIKVFRVQVPWDLERLGDVYKQIVEHSTL